MLRLFTICLSALFLAGTAHCANNESWQEPVPALKLDFGYKPTDFQTTFWELMPGRLAPLDTKTAIGIPGWPVIGYGYLMRTRYSEFDMRMSTQTSDGERFVHTRPNFKQRSPGDWLPGAVSDWDDAGIHYQVSYICVPGDPQPVDMYRISLKNTSGNQAQGTLLVTLDGAPTLKTEGDLISDRGKPLIVMDPAVPVKRIVRPAGVIDPRATASGTWRYPSSVIDQWRSRRTGWYGMPVEYVLKVDGEKPLQVFLGFNNEPLVADANWDLPDEAKHPDILAPYKDPGQEIVATVEGDANNRKVKTGVGSTRQVLKFVGKDTDGDGYVKVSVRATPESRGPAVLAVLWAFDAGIQVTADELLKSRTQDAPTTNEAYFREIAKADDSPLAQKAKYIINCGDDFPCDVGTEWAHIGKDPTAFALQLQYSPTLAVGEEKVYCLKLPAIDKPEVAPYGSAWRPWDTGDTWKPHLESRHPENNASYAFDVPPGTDPADYAMNGPKSKDTWQKQLSAARSMSWGQGTKQLTDYWEGFEAKRAKLLSPEPLVDNLYKHNLAILQMHRVKFGNSGYELQLTGPDWYWDIAISRDTPYMHLVWEWSGYLDVAKSLWKTILTPRSDLPVSRWTVGQWEGSPELAGLWIARPAQWSGQGQFLWSLYNHFMITGDMKELSDNYARIRKGAEWIVLAIEREKKALKDDPNAIGYGMLPPCGSEDGGTGHNYYVNSYIVLGLESAERIAEALDKKEDADRWKNQARDLKAAIKRHIRLGFFRLNDFAGVFSTAPEWFPGPDYTETRDGKQVAKLPPEKILDTSYGCPLVYPTRSMAPFDPLMQGWFRYREHLAETTSGLFGNYGPSVASDQGLAYIFRGEPDKAADQFYTFVDHASGCLDFGEAVEASVYPEFEPPKEGIRTGGQMPHGFSSALYIYYLRSLLIMEDGSDLRLAPAIPRNWLAQPKPVGVENAPTRYGPVTYHLVADPNRVTIRGDVKLDPKRKPARLLVHVRAPGGRGIESVTVNGQAWLGFFDDTVIIPNPPSRIKIVAKYKS